MRRAAAAVLAAFTLLATAAPALAHPRSELEPTLPTDLTHARTDNLEYLGRFPEHSGTAGGRVLGDRFYLTDPRGIYVYDISTPEDPVRLGFLPLAQSYTGAALAQEDPDTNGEILLVDAVNPDDPNPLNELQVVDVSDPADMSVLSTVAVNDHTWTCVSGVDDTGETDSCAYAYGRTGNIVDLTDPTDAKLLPNTWRLSVGYGNDSNSPYAHDLTEIRPGLVMSAGAQNILMDTTDPANPQLLNRIGHPGRFSSLGYHSVEWSNGGLDDYAIFGTEISPSGPTSNAGSDCVGDNSVIETWKVEGLPADAGQLLAEGATIDEVFGNLAFTKVDAFDAGSRGIFLEGQAPGHVLYCAHWMEPHPDFDDGGKVVVSYYDRGTRFLDVKPDGTMQEIAWITAAEGYSGSAQWISDDVVYIMDYRRGMEVVKLVDEEAGGVTHHGYDVIAAGSSITALHDGGGLDWRLLSGASLAVGLALLALHRRRRTATAA